jgi:hypothetical protein
LAEAEVGGGATTATVAQQEQVLPPGRGGARRKWLVIGAIVAVFVLVIAYLVAGASVAAASSGRAEKAVKATIGHQAKVGPVLEGDAFKGIDFSSSNLDVGTVKVALGNFDAQLAPVLSLVKADQAALQEARVGQDSVLTLPEQGILKRDRQKVDAAISALKSAETLLNYDRQQSAFLHPFFDALGSLDTLTKSEEANDLAGAQSQVAAADASLQKTLAQAKPPAITPQMVDFVKEMQALVADLKGLLTAAQAHDLAGVQKWTAAGDADSKKISSYDQAAADKAESALFKPLSDSYNRQMKVAAGQ